MIEETKKTCTDCIHYEICSLWTTVDLDEDEAYKYCFGHYRHRTPENAVVMMREEFDEDYVTKEDRDYWKHKAEIYKEHLKKSRKETAEKFAEMLKEDVSEDNELHERLNYYLKRDYFEYIDERCKELTEGK